jgi:phage shock protein C
MEKPNIRRLHRSRNNRVIAGVCGGLSEYFNIDPMVIRLIWVASIFLGGVGLIAYILCALIIPEAPFGTVSPPTSFRSASPTALGIGVAIILIGLGVIFLFSNLFGWSIWSWFWKLIIPLALIALGLFLVFRLRRR